MRLKQAAAIGVGAALTFSACGGGHEQSSETPSQSSEPAASAIHLQPLPRLYDRKVDDINDYKDGDLSVLDQDPPSPQLFRTLQVAKVFAGITDSIGLKYCHTMVLPNDYFSDNEPLAFAYGESEILPDGSEKALPKALGVLSVNKATGKTNIQLPTVTALRHAGVEHARVINLGKTPDPIESGDQDQNEAIIMGSATVNVATSYDFAEYLTIELGAPATQKPDPSGENIERIVDVRDVACFDDLQD